MYGFRSGHRDLLTGLFSENEGCLVLTSNKEGLITGWNNSVSSKLRYSDEELAGQPISNIILELNPPEPGLFPVLLKTGERVLLKGTILSLHGSPGEAAGTVHILGTAAAYDNGEITPRTLLGALENSNMTISRLDGMIEHWTAGCERLYGYSAEEATGQIGHELLQTEFPIPREQLQQELLSRGVWGGELKQRNKTGSAVFVSALLARLDSRPDVEPLVVGTYSDITSRLEMQHELESANLRLKLMADELERSNEELEEFARIASHDLSAPITSTRWLVELLSTRHGKQLDQDGQRALAQVGVSLERMSDLVAAVLAHAQVGKTAIATLQEADTELAVEVALENLRHDVSTTGAQVTYHQLPPLLIGQQPLTQLFQNLLSNAIKYRRPDTEPIIHITGEKLGPLWRISVKDNGMGIETEWHERIFLPMQRRHSSKIAGSGIGLATCRKIVNRAGGRLWVESELERGSTFLFTLPGATPGS